MTARKPIIMTTGSLEQIQSGDYVSPGCLGSGTPSASTYLSGANTWDTLPGGSGTFEISTSNIKMDGAVSVGSLTTYPRADHIHPSDTSRLPLSGGTMTGNEILANNVSLSGVSYSLGTKNIVHMDNTANQLVLGDYGITTLVLGTLSSSSGGPFITNPYQSFGFYTMSTTQTTGLAAGNHVQFDTNSSVSGLNNIQTGSGQANGKLTLAAFGTYRLMGSIRGSFSGITGNMNMQFRDETNGIYIGPVATLITVTNATSNQNSSLGLCHVFSPGTSNIDISLSFSFVTALSGITSSTAWMYVEQIG